MTDSATQQQTQNIDNLTLPLVQPETAVEVGEIVKQARAAGEAVYPVGGGTLLAYGLPPAKKGVAVNLGKLHQVIDYPARDMTITVQAGITLAELQRILAEENQRLPIDFPHAGSATLGGALAVNASGPRRYGCGTLRDYVIGITVVNDEGEQVKAGGRVVKNVAGYDLGKLYIGSLGTLGIITQVTLKVVPRCEENAFVVLQAGDDELNALLYRLHESRSRPVCLELLNQAAGACMRQEYQVELPEAEWLVVAGFEGNADTVKWQVQQLVDEMADYHPHVVGDAHLINALAEFPGWTAAGLTFKASMLPSCCADFCRQISALPERPLLQAHAGNGIVIGHLHEEVTQQQATDFIKQCRALLAEGGGACVVLQCPAAWKTADFVWGKPRGDLALMRSIKEKLDPQRIFNPGRFYGEI